MKNRITKSERLQLIGLMTLARKHSKISDEANIAMHDILEEPEGYSLLTDKIYDEAEPDVDKVLKLMEIEVRK